MLIGSPNDATRSSQDPLRRGKRRKKVRLDRRQNGEGTIKTTSRRRRGVCQERYRLGEGCTRVDRASRPVLLVIVVVMVRKGDGNSNSNSLQSRLLRTRVKSAVVREDTIDEWMNR